MGDFILVKSGILPEDGDIVISQDSIGRKYKSYFFTRQCRGVFKLFGSAFEHSYVVSWRKSGVDIDGDFEYRFKSGR